MTRRDHHWSDTAPPALIADEVHYPAEFTKVGPVRFYDDGTASVHGTFGGVRKSRSGVVDVEGSNSIRNKETVGRAAGALLTGGLSLLGSSTVGGYTVVILTEDWAYTWHGAKSWSSMYERMIEQAMLARRRWAMAAQQHPSTRRR